MKVKTNLTPRELEVVAKGLDCLAKSQAPYTPIKAENDAERVLLEGMKAAFSEFQVNLEEDLRKLVK